ncbi:hypothetical protein [Paraurantiacibacter namhicola]|uniref:HAD family hydrolase n=1 Tax=Paraurantiacibacter namhicola TaxID=645517 RepID=A0A1C7D542_9SPHN|nr:hypothetical protein [Paraurantiacibacter namhicola]ANU06580.1 hypothetical protein A6F65_00253 [Paraurantiacibacter namhicola]
MKRPLVITDCDEVLLHMVRPFRDWLGREHGIDFALEGNPFIQSMSRPDGSTLTEAEVWEMLGGFFDTEMGTQTPIEGALEAMAKLQGDADVVVLTNLNHSRNEARTRQLAALGFETKVYTNQGPKGAALARILAEHEPSRAVFIDDLAVHHASARQEIGHIHRLHLCGEPSVAPHIPCAYEAGDAHARIDRWAEALPWIEKTLLGEST